MKAGNILIVNKKGKDASWMWKFWYVLQRFFTGAPYTHTALTSFTNETGTFVFSVEELLTLRFLDDFLNLVDSDLYIFEINLEESILTPFVNKQIKNFLGQNYGYAQLIWFVYRWIMEKFGKDVRRDTNWFANGEICSESVYLYLQDLATIEPDLKRSLNQFNQNTCDVGDIMNILQHYPDLFKMIYKKINGKEVPVINKFNF